MKQVNSLQKKPEFQFQPIQIMSNYDSEYERNGTANIFMFFNPIEGKRRVVITDNRTAKDWAQQIK